jgi:transcriptional regulator GlxA family with amidase domain
MSGTTKRPQIRTSTASRSIVCVAPPDAQLLDIVGPLEAFQAANQVLRFAGKPAAYTLEVAAHTTELATASGLRIRATPLARAPIPHTLLVGGSFDLATASLSDAWLASIRRLACRAERIASVCTGAFVLGRLGLLDGRRCTTHWLALDALRRQFPAARVDDDTLYTTDGALFTSAGVTSGIDLALHLIERDLGAGTALTVARGLVVFLHRPGGQSQFSASLRLHASADERIRRLVAAIVERPRGDYRVEILAKRAGMSTRHFARFFCAQTGSTPAAFVERARLDAARTALERTDHTVDAIADTCGFGTRETLRRVFQRSLGVAPSDYRARFAP